MVPTLEVGQRVLVDRVSFRFSDPDRGDIVVFKPPAGADANACGVEHPPPTRPARGPRPERSDTNFIKRVVARGRRPAEGDRRRGLHQRQAPEGAASRASTRRAGICNLPKEITIPKGYYFMMGDNRGESADSREWGPIPKKWIIGKAF